MHNVQPAARLGGLVASGLIDVTSDLAALDSAGRWAVVIPYRGDPVLAHFEHWISASAASVAGAWTGPQASTWKSSLNEQSYIASVQRVRALIESGDVYQANVCRVLSAQLSDPNSCDVGGLHALLDAGNPSPYGGFVRVPGAHVATASPELFLRRTGRHIESGPIKGTGRVEADLTQKDRAENIMIVDLVRNDLSAICDTGSVSVPELLKVEEHPGLVHLVSRVAGELRNAATWPEILASTFPPGSVTGAPKSSALRIIDDVESVSRDVYCGSIGWVDADTGEAVLAVAIRTFWVQGDQVHFGTGAGITWGSDPTREWQETQLKAAHLIDVASGVWQGAIP